MFDLNLIQNDFLYQYGGSICDETWVVCIQKVIAFSVKNKYHKYTLVDSTFLDFSAESPRPAQTW